MNPATVQDLTNNAGKVPISKKHQQVDASTNLSGLHVVRVKLVVIILPSQQLIHLSGDFCASCVKEMLAICCDTMSCHVIFLNLKGRLKETCS